MIGSPVVAQPTSLNANLNPGTDQTAPPNASTKIGHITYAELPSDLARPHVFIIDARSHDDFKKGHIPNAINLSTQDFNADYRRNSGRWQKETKPAFVVYCASARCHASDAVAFFLTHRGFTQIVIFSGGWEEWEQHQTKT